MSKEKLISVTELPGVLTNILGLKNCVKDTIPDREAKSYKMISGPEAEEIKELLTRFYSKALYDDYSLDPGDRWLTPSVKLMGNYHAFILSRKVFDLIDAKKRSAMPDEVAISPEKLHDLSFKHTLSQNYIHSTGLLDFQRLHDVGNRDRFVRIHEWIDCFEHAMTSASLAVSKKSFSIEPGNRTVGASKIVYEDFIFYKFKDLNIIHMKGDKDPHIMLTPHFERFIHLLRVYSSLSIVLHSLAGREHSSNILRSIVDVMSDMAEDNPHNIGEALKGARQCYLLGIDTDKFTSDSPVKSYKMTCSVERRENIAKIENALGNYPLTKTQKATICGLYKAIPHPDANMRKIWENILGFKEPNKVDPIMIRRIEGTIRKSLYASMLSSGFDPRLEATAEVSHALVSKSASTQVFKSEMMRYSTIEWANTRFQQNRKVMPPKEIELKVRDKASQNPSGTPDMLPEAKSLSENFPNKVPLKYPELGSSNDALRYLSGDDQIGVGAYIKRFESMIAKHEEFENSYLERGIAIDDIPSKDLEDFVMKEGNHFLVGTEPKFGEFHKEFTRMFYMAEPALKSLTQRTERVARQISRQQVGVSIVKSYRARRKDLEAFAHGMGNVTSRRNPVFISFDLSEFSKKFPMALVRMYGGILSELTGEKWMRRIDLFFRASIVLHNSRGFFDYTAGVKGGFEGFLNFVWSSIHAAVMDIAIEATGVQGQLLTFSDDGLMYFVPAEGETKDMIKKKIEKIRRVYSKCGLEFNLFKVIVSTNVWEYLGDFCTNGHIAPAWIKEVGSIGRSMRGSGILTVADSLDAIIGQFRASISAGMPGYIGHFLMTYYACKRIIRITGYPGEAVLRALLITPRSCGGFRLPSIYELTSSSSVKAYQEFLADLVLEKRSEGRVCDLVIEFITRHLTSSNRFVDCAVYGLPFKTSGIKTSGMEVINKVLDMVVENSGIKVATNPITGRVKKAVRAFLESSEFCDISVFSKFLQSTEQWDEYQNSLSVAKSASAIKILSRSSIKKLQAEDTRNVRNAVRAWKEVNGDLSKTYTIPQVITMFEAWSKQIYRRAAIDLGQMSLRMVSSLPEEYYQMSEDSFIKVSIDTSDSRNACKADSDYREPVINFPLDLTTGSWLSEASGAGEIRAARKNIETVASICSASPEYYPVLRTISQIFGIELPLILPRRSSYQRRAADEFGRADVMIAPPRFPWAKSHVTYGKRLGDALFSLSRGDRSTYTALARNIACHHWDSLICPGPKVTLNKDIHDFTFRIPLQFYRRLFINDKLKFNETKYRAACSRLGIGVKMNLEAKLHKASKRVTFEAALTEALDDQEKIDNQIDQYIPVTEDEDVQTVIDGIAKYRQVQWVRSLSVEGTVGMIPHKSIPENHVYRLNTIVEAIIEGTYLYYSGAQRRQIVDVCMRRPGVSSTSLMIYEDYKLRVRRNASMIAQLSPELFREILTDKRLYDDIGIDLQVGRMVESESMVSKYDTKIYMSTPVGWDSNLIHNTAKEIYRRMCTNTITTLYSRFAKARWKEEDVEMSIPGLPTDDLINIVTIIRPLMRQSRHRKMAQPFNNTTFKIWLARFYAEAYSKVPLLNMLMKEYCSSLPSLIASVTGFSYVHVASLIKLSKNITETTEEDPDLIYTGLRQVIPDYDLALKETKHDNGVDSDNDSDDPELDDEAEGVYDSSDDEEIGGAPAKDLKSSAPREVIEADPDDEFYSIDGEPIKVLRGVDRVSRYYITGNLEDIEDREIDLKKFTSTGLLMTRERARSALIAKRSRSVVDPDDDSWWELRDELIGDMDPSTEIYLEEAAREIGPDHAHILSSPFPKEYKRRLDVFVKHLKGKYDIKEYCKRHRVDPSNPEILIRSLADQYDKFVPYAYESKINNAATILRDKVIKPLAKRIVSFQPEMEILSMNLPVRLAPVAEVSSQSGDSVRISPDVSPDIPLNKIVAIKEYGVDKTILEIVTSLFHRFMIMTGLRKFKDIKSDSVEVRDMAKRYIEKDGHGDILELCSQNMHDDHSDLSKASGVFVRLSYSTYKDAVNTFLRLKIVPDSVLVIAEADGITGTLYTVLGFIRGWDIKFKNGLPDVASDTMVRSMYILRASTLYSFLTSTQYHDSSVYGTALTSFAPPIVASFGSMMKGRVEEIIDNPLLGCAYTIFSSHDTKNGKELLWGTVCFISYLLGGLTKDDAVGVYNVVKNLMSTNKMHIVGVLKGFGDYLSRHLLPNFMGMSEDLSFEVCNDIYNANPVSETANRWFVINPIAYFPIITTCSEMRLFCSSLDSSVLQNPMVVSYIVTKGAVPLSKSFIRSDDEIEM